MSLVLAVVASYLWGAIPTAYGVARLRRGVDLRRVGSGNVGSSNLVRAVGKWPAIVVGLTDVAKGAVPVYLGQLAGWDLTGAGLLGLAAIGGHNWPVYLRFSGGRGLAATLGVLLVIAPWGWLPILAGLGLGTLARRTALGAIVGLALVPLLAMARREPKALTHILWALLGLTVLKRLWASGGPAPSLDWKRVLFNRLLYDRDVGPDEIWNERSLLV